MDTEGNCLHNEWRYVCIGDIAEVVSGGTPSTKKEEYYGDEIAWITPKDLSGYSSKYILKGERSITSLGLENSSAKLLPPNTILFSSRAPIGYVVISKGELATNQGFKNLVCDSNKVDFQFMYYKMKILKEALEAVAGGSTFKEVSGKVVKEFKIILPTLQEQKAIANILSSLDEKIELNNQMNKTLEEMAQTLFKRWFVDFEFPNEDGEPYKSSGGEMVDSELGMIPKGWKIGCLGDIANIVMGQSPKGSTYNEEGVGEVFFQGRAEFGVRFPKRRLFTSEPKRMANKGDILMSVRAPVGDLNIAHEKCCIGRGLSAIQSKYGYSSFILYTMFNLEKQLNVFNGEGTVFGSINKNGLNDLKLLIPSQSIIKIFEEVVSKMDGTIENNYDEVCSLEAIRDTLLPKLMSGEIRVTDLQN